MIRVKGFFKIVVKDNVSLKGLHNFSSGCSIGRCCSPVPEELEWPPGHTTREGGKWSEPSQALPSCYLSVI